MNKRLYSPPPTIGAIALYLATAMGAGIFAIPYVVARTGVGWGIILLVSVAILTHVTVMVYAEVIGRTPGTHQLTGYATLYLGKTGRWVALVSQLIGTYGALVAYLLGISAFFSAVIPKTAELWSGKMIGIIFWIIAAFAIQKGLRAVARFELMIMLGLFVIFTVLIAVGLPALRFAHWRGGDLTLAWQAFGVMLFAFGALGVIPEIRRFLLHRRRLSAFPHVLQWGISMTFTFYLFFTILAIGIVGAGIGDNAIISIGAVLGPTVLGIGAIFGIMTMGSSYIASSFVLREMYHFDFRFSRFSALAWTMVPPLFLFLFDIATFVQVLFVTGIIAGGVQGVLVFRMLSCARAHGKHPPIVVMTMPRWLSVFMQFLYVIGAFTCLLLFFVS